MPELTHPGRRSHRLRSDQSDIWEIGAIASGVASYESQSLGFGVGSDVKVRQRGTLVAACSSVFQERLRRQPTGGVWQWEQFEDGGIKPRVKFRLRGESGCQFRIDDGVDHNRTLCCCGSKLCFRPSQPRDICSRNIEQHVRIEQQTAHSSPRVRDITSSVVASGRAAPRALFSQASTDNVVARLARWASSQCASSSTCGAGNRSIACSISVMVLMPTTVSLPPNDVQPQNIAFRSASVLNRSGWLPTVSDFNTTHGVPA